MAFSTLVLKLLLSQSISLHSHLSLHQADAWQSLAAVVLVSAAASPAGFWAHYNVLILTYLLYFFGVQVELPRSYTEGGLVRGTWSWSERRGDVLA